MKKYLDMFKAETNTGTNIRDLATFIAFIDWMVIRRETVDVQTSQNTGGGA